MPKQGKSLQGDKLDEAILDAEDKQRQLEEGKDRQAQKKGAAELAELRRHWFNLYPEDAEREKAATRLRYGRERRVLSASSEEAE